MRVSCTTLESFRLWSQPDQDWMAEEELIATIKGEFTPNAAVRLGQAFGRILERPDAYRIPQGYAVDSEFTFSEATMAPALQLLEHDRPFGVFEAKAQKRYGAVDVVAKADFLVGAHLREFKTTTSTFNFEKYADSCQWRFMVDIFEPAYVTYDIFRLGDHGNSVVELVDIESFHLFPYDALHQDCCELLDRFVAYVTRRGLDGVLRERQQKAEAA